MPPRANITPSVVEFCWHDCVECDEACGVRDWLVFRHTEALRLVEGFADNLAVYARRHVLCPFLQIAVWQWLERGTCCDAVENNAADTVVLGLNVDGVGADVCGGEGRVSAALVGFHYAFHGTKASSEMSAIAAIVLQVKFSQPMSMSAV